VDTHGLAYKRFFGDYIIGEKDYRKYKENTNKDRKNKFLK